MNKPNAPRVSVVIPSYNEASTVPSVIRLVLAQDEVHEVIVVDDGSRDGTWTELEKLVVENDRIRIMRHDHNLGKGAALRSGFAKVTGSISSFKMLIWNMTLPTTQSY